MKVLMIFPYAPMPPPLDLGGTKRNLPFLLELVKYNEVSVLSFGTPEQERLFRKHYGKRCGKVRFIKRRPRVVNGLLKVWLLATCRGPFKELYHLAMQRAIFAMVAENDFDVIHCCTQMFGSFRFPEGIPITSDTHEVKYQLLRRSSESTRNPIQRLAQHLGAKYGKAQELSYCRRFDLLTTTTEKDRDTFMQDLPDQRMKVVQNGAGDTFFENLSIESEPYSLVFTGLFTHLPNSEGIMYFLNDVYPRIRKVQPQARIYIVGKNPTGELKARQSDHVIVTGFVDDVRPYMARAKVYVIPLLAGGGIRGKALEAMAMKRPIVTTSIGVEGIHLYNEKSALFADSPQAFADAVLRLFDDANLWNVLVNNAYETAVNQYNWESKGKELDYTLRSAVEAHESGPVVEVSRLSKISGSN